MIPPIKIPAFITREFVQSHLGDYIFIYSSPLNLNSSTGQRASILDCNCYPVPVRDKMCKSSGYWTDATLFLNCTFIESWLKDVPEDWCPVIPFPNIGAGGSRLITSAPLTYKFLHEELAKIKYGNIVYYNAATDVLKPKLINIQEL
jgi:hypothetical protein